MLWSYDLNKEKESEKVKPENLFKSGKLNTYTNDENKIINEKCVEAAVNIYGINIFVVLSYEEAINELTKNIKGKCDYNSVWIMCGPQKAILPNPKSDPNLIGEFMKIINKFWENGGSLIFFADGDPLFYQVNLFLKNAEFPIDEEELEKYNNKKEILNQIYENERNNSEHEESEENRENEDNENKIFESGENILTNRTEIENYDYDEEDNKEDNIKNNDNNEVNKKEEENDDDEEEIICTSSNKNENIFCNNKLNLNKKINNNNKITVNFEIKGSHKGQQYLFADFSGKLEEKKYFNAKKSVITSLGRPNIGNNLLKIYEGVTISYVENNSYNFINRLENFMSRRHIEKIRNYIGMGKDDENDKFHLFPFVPFALDSDGGVSIMIYYGRQNYGDVVIDCGFTKCFIEIDQLDTFRYIRNLSAVTSRVDVLFKKGYPKDWKPNAIDYRLNQRQDYIWSEYKRMIYIIDSENPVSKDDKEYIYNEILSNLYSPYNNKIFFVNSRNMEIELEDLLKENSLKPELNQLNPYDIIENIVNEYEEKGYYYEITIFTDGIQLNDIKITDYIMAYKNISDMRKFLEMLPYSNRQFDSEKAKGILNNLENIKTYDNFISNYKDIRNSLVLMGNDYSFGASRSKIIEDIKNFSEEIIGKIEDDNEKKKILSEKMNILSFYLNTSLEYFGVNAAAFKNA